jgi:hypothetical protein
MGDPAEDEKQQQANELQFIHMRKRSTVHSAQLKRELCMYIIEDHLLNEVAGAGMIAERVGGVGAVLVRLLDAAKTAPKGQMSDVAGA